MENECTVEKQALLVQKDCPDKPCALIALETFTQPAEQQTRQLTDDHIPEHKNNLSN